jgi:hypothetical protein
MRPTILAGLGALLVIGAAQAQEPRQYARCTAAERDAPTLDKRIFPDAAFEMVEDQVGQGRGPNGPVPLYLKHGFERVKLPDGTQLEVNLTGCDHHGNAYRFRVPKDNTPTTETKYWLERAIDMVGRVEKGNVDGMVDLPALKRTLQTRAGNPDARPFRDGSLDGTVYRGGSEDRGRIQEAYLVTINQRREDTTVISVTYLIGPL